MSLAISDRLGVGEWSGEQNYIVRLSENARDASFQQDTIRLATPAWAAVDSYQTSQTRTSYTPICVSAR